MNLPRWYLEYKNLIENSINDYLVDYFSDEKNKWLNFIKEATLYSVKWWKRIRSILALEFYLVFTWYTFEDLINEKDSDSSSKWHIPDIIKLCIAIELLHAYSLVHDDLPAMDNDEYRRWNLTTWKKYWEANAVLVWDLLNSQSFELLATMKNTITSFYLWQAVWLKWMLWGQVLDLYYENNPEKLTLDNLIETHNKKTWALIETSIFCWILCSAEEVHFVNNEETNNQKKFLDFWKKIWLAFQVKDDLLDVEWNLEETWKSVWDWEEKWFVYFMWLEETHKYLDKLIFDSKEIIKELNSEKLEFLVDYIWNRKK